MTIRSLLRVAAAAAFVLHGCMCLMGQPAAGVSGPPASAPPAAVSVAETTGTAAVEARIKTVEGDASLSAEDRKALLETLGQSLELARAAESWSRKNAEMEDLAKGAPERIAAIEKALAAEAATPADIPSTATADQLDRMAAVAETDFAAAQKKTADLRAELSARGTRRAALPKQVAGVKESLQALGGEKSTVKPGDTPSQMDAAGAMLRAMRRNALEAELAAYEKELAAFDTLTQLQTLLADQAARNAEAAEAALARLREAATQRRRDEAGEAVRAARQASLDAAATSPLLRKLAEENEQLARRRTGPDGLSASIENTQAELDATRQLQSRLQLMMDNLKKRVDAVGNTQAVGLLLRKTLAELPDVDDLGKRAAARADTIVKVQSELLDIDDQRMDLGRVAQETSRALAAAGGGEADPELFNAGRELLMQRRRLLDSISSDMNTWFSALVDLDSLEREVIGQHRAAAQYIGQRVLYVQSAPPIGVSEIRRAANNLALLFGSGFWLHVAGTLRNDARARPDLYLPVLLLAPCLLFYRRRMKAYVQRIGERILSGGQKTAMDGLAAFAVTLVMAVPAPAFFYFLAWRLVTGPETGPAEKAIGAGLRVASVFYMHMAALGLVSMPRGLAEAYLGWSAQRLRLLVRNLRWLLPLTLLAAFQVAALTSIAGTGQAYAPGRPLFMVFMIALSVFFHNVFHPSRGVIAGWLDANPDGWATRTRHAWYGALVVMPVVFMVAAAMGHYYTAAMLLGRVVRTILVVFWALVVRDMLLQQVVIAGRNLAQRFARRQQDTAVAPDAQEDAAAMAPAEVYELGGRLRRLITMAVGAATMVVLYANWVDVLPALHMFDRVELWTYTGKVTETVTTADGSIRAQTVEKLLPVTLGSLVLALIVVVLTISAARNIPALMEITVLRRLAIDSGLRYALTSVMCYGIAIAGTVATLQMLGVTWASVQWLAAAITVGLGFGLQEIFANFVSGLIILFERPIRVGDTVTVGDVSGTVTSIHIRATTIRGWDGKDLIVPNRQIITGHVLNWTLSDSVTRLEFLVGVAYGSDTGRVRGILLDVARSHPRVLADPEPAANLVGLGPHSLDFKLFAHVAQMTDRLVVTTDIHTAILRRFAEAGIEIPFPRRTIEILPGAPGADKTSGTA